MNTDHRKHIRTERTDDDLVQVILNVAGRSVNVLDEDVLLELEQVVAGLEEDTGLAGVLFRSSKPSGFLAGADVARIAKIRTAGEARAIVRRGQELFSRIEQLGVPTVAAIHGPCLGGGLELALACSARIAIDDGSTRLGLPEVQLGLLPAWGGTQRLPRLIGLVPALNLILTGRRLRASTAHRMGLVDRLADGAGFEAAALDFLRDLSSGAVGPLPVCRSPRKILAWGTTRTRIGRALVKRVTSRRLASSARQYPALQKIVKVTTTPLTTNNLQSGFDREAAAFSRLLFTPACRNLLGLFFSREQARTPESWIPATAEPASTADLPEEEVLGVIGAGVMGAGIAALAVSRGIPVVVREATDELLETGLGRIRSQLEQSAKTGRMSRDELRDCLARLSGSTDLDALRRATIVVEAVPERLEIKQAVFGELASQLPPHTILATNTSSLTVGAVFEALPQPARHAGLHFFNPVHRMELVEVVRTDHTDSSTIARLVQLVRRLGKTPVVVHDSPGFLVNRVLFPYMAEATELVAEGANIDTIDRVMRRFGMPMGPLELLDQVGLDVAAEVAAILGDRLPGAAKVEARLATLRDQGHLGRKSNRGFYEYRHGKRNRSVPPEWAETAFAESRPDASLIERRLTASLLGESVRAMQDGVIDEAAMLDLALVLGTGFAPFRGGPLQVIDDRGPREVLDDLTALAETCGDRFAPPELLRQYAINGRTFRPPQVHEVTEEAVTQHSDGPPSAPVPDERAVPSPSASPSTQAAVHAETSD